MSGYYFNDIVDYWLLFWCMQHWHCRWGHTTNTNCSLQRSVGVFFSTFPLLWVLLHTWWSILLSGYHALLLTISQYENWIRILLFWFFNQSQCPFNFPLYCRALQLCSTRSLQDCSRRGQGSSSQFFITLFKIKFLVKSFSGPWLTHFHLPCCVSMFHLF